MSHTSYTGRMVEIVKQTSHMGTLVIRPVSKDIAKDLIVKNHYSHKWNTPFGLYNFGIFRQDSPQECLGVAAYGYMKNPRANIFVSDVPGGWIIELLRLFDPTIVAVQSFADGRLGCGTIYKAANFQYYGHHLTCFFRDKRTGEIFQAQSLTDSSVTSTFLRRNLDLLLGHLEGFRVKTYRYIYPFHRSFRFTARKRQPYPAYERGSSPIEMKIDPDHLVGRLSNVLLRQAQKYANRSVPKDS